MKKMQKNEIENTKKEKNLFFILLVILVASLVVALLKELWKFFAAVAVIGILYLLWKNPNLINMKK
ncbi:MAG TPA: hypothetical protein VI894_02735 [Candidatus Nanoarchaeia archaeon]|nr:hypothetical protein [Candidatus Nanoarchaeia archaeon]